MSYIIIKNLCLKRVQIIATNITFIDLIFDRYLINSILFLFLYCVLVINGFYSLLLCFLYVILLYHFLFSLMVYIFFLGFEFYSCWILLLFLVLFGCCFLVLNGFLLFYWNVYYKLVCFFMFFFLLIIFCSIWKCTILSHSWKIHIYFLFIFLLMLSYCAKWFLLFPLNVHHAYLCVSMLFSYIIFMFYLIDSEYIFLPLGLESCSWQ